MYEVYNDDDLQKHLSSITPSGYTKGEEGFYHKDETVKKIRLEIDYDEYFPHGVHFTGCGISVVFNNVEQIYHTVLANYPNTGYSNVLAYSETFTEQFVNYVITTKERDDLYALEVNDENTFNQARPILLKMMNAALAFLNQHQTLQDFYNFGETLTIDEMSNYYDQPLPQKRMIVKKLVNASDYNSYANELIDFYTNEEPDANEAAFIQGLKTYLDANY